MSLPAPTAIPWLPPTPANWRQFIAEFVELGPRLWPKRLYKRGGDGHAEAQAFGEGLGATRVMLEWLLRSYHPQNDSEGLWLGHWEKFFGLVVSEDLAITTRQNRIISAARTRGQGNKALIQAVFAPVFGFEDPTRIAFETPDLSQASVADLEWHRSLWGHQMRIYDSLETQDPDVAAGESIIDKTRPAGYRWTFGRYKRFMFTTAGAGFGATFS